MNHQPLNTQTSETNPTRRYLIQGLEAFTTNPYPSPVDILDTKMGFVIACHTNHLDLAHAYRQYILQELEQQGLPIVANLTYEDIILNNPEGPTMRTFSGGDERQQEILFHQGHKDIEVLMASAINGLEHAHETGELEGLAHAATMAEGSVDLLQKIFLNKINPNVFQRYRQYLGSNPITNEKGPSGAFSAKVQHVGALLYGSSLPEDIQASFIEDEKYYPQKDLLHLRTNMARGIDIRTQFRRRPEARPAIEALTAVADLLYKFRARHNAVVKTQLGDEFLGTAEGQDARAFLAQRTKQFKKLRNETRNPITELNGDRE